MKGLLVLFATIAAAAGLFEPGLRTTWSVGIDYGGSFFYELPMTTADATNAGWVNTRPPKGISSLNKNTHALVSKLVMRCPLDKIVCCFYDDTGYIAGIQIATSKEEFSDTIYDRKTQGFTSWNTDVDGQCKKFWTIQQYFVDEEFLAKSKEDRLAARDSTRVLQAGAIWVTGIHKQLVKIPILEDDIASEGVFTKQYCMWWMGQHYYHNMTTTTECSAETMFPWFPLYQDPGNGVPELIGLGFMTFGKHEVEQGKRDWFEYPDSAAVKMIVPDGPECLYKLADSPGVVTMHTYYIDKPWTVYC